MIHRLDYVPLEDVLQILEIDHHTRYRIRITLYCNLHNVIVAMSVRVGLFSEKPIIFRLVQRTNATEMGCGKFRLARDLHYPLDAGPRPLDTGIYRQVQVIRGREPGEFSSIGKVTTNNVLRALLGAFTAVFIGLIVFSLRDTSAKEGGRAPEFSIATDQGQRVTPVSFGGKVLVLNFWATWCSPCVQEIPSLNEFQKRFAKSGVVVVAVSIDKNPGKYRAFLDRIHVSFDTARDPQAEISARYGTFQYPETYIIKDGRVMRKFANAEDWVSDDMTQYIQSLL
jgi:peroxiredoxin